MLCKESRQDMEFSVFVMGFFSSLVSALFDSFRRANYHDVRLGNLTWLASLMYYFQSTVTSYDNLY